MNRQVVWLKSPEQRVGVVTTRGLARFAQKNMPEAYAARYGRERKRANGEVYIDKSGGGTYGHRECLLQLVNVKPDILALNISSGMSKRK